ncbi:hypothetical protein OH77DRAFT_1567590 [Trametes cingulata]|nr:hypothetical protein OH77DRAFT_1567590 [Trametes cingulata]
MPLSYDISFNLPPRLYPEKYPGFEHYLILKEQVCYDYRNPPKYRQLYAEGLQEIQKHPEHHFKRGLLMKDGPMMVECCIRTLAMCEVPMDLDGPDPIMGLLKAVAGLTANSGFARMATTGKTAPKIRNFTPQLQLHALAAFAYMNFYSHWFSPLGGQLKAMSTTHVMYNAAFAANQCVQRGFIPPVALHIAGWLATTNARFAVDVRQMHSDYLRHLQDKEELRLAKVSKAPHVYRCANEGCDIRATHKGALKQCGGDCPPARKPHYCSRYCQRRHWIIHREFCMELDASDFTDIVEDDGHPDWVDVVGFQAPKVPDPHWDKKWRVWAEREGPEIFIDILNDSPYRKGQVIRLRTRTLSPECLKAYKRLWTHNKSEAARREIDATLSPECESPGLIEEEIEALAKEAARTW